MTDQQIATYRYRLNSTGYSSTRYGLCEICSKYASEVFFQIEERKYYNGVRDEMSWTRNKCHSYFGHRECLESKQR